MSPVITHHPESLRFIATLDGRPVGSLHYRPVNGEWDLYSTLVGTDYEGLGVGSALVQVAVAEANRAGVGILPSCWFVAGWLERHPDAHAQSASDHVTANREHWDAEAPQWVAAGERLWSSEPQWGTWGASEEELRLLPPSAEAMRTLELGCGTGYVSSWLARRGADAIGLDNSLEQLRTAVRLREQHRVPVEFLHGDAEALPFEDEMFDMAITEYGAVTWCDPAKWVPEAARVLRPGGRLSVFGGSPWLTMCTPLNGDFPDLTLHRDYFGLRRTDWREVEIDPGGVQFDLTISGWFDTFTSHGLRIERFHEVQAPADASDSRWIHADWARRLPAEQAWVLTKVW